MSSPHRGFRSRPLIQTLHWPLPTRAADDDLDAEFAGAHILVFAGGSGFNEAAYKLRDTPTHVSYVMPVSDDGGSSAEIQRVIGGPSIGDIRARLVRLAAEDTKERRFLSCCG